MAFESDPTTLVLLGLRLKGFGDPASVAAIIAAEESLVVEQLEAAAAAEHALHRQGGNVSGWALTAEGRAHGEVLLAAELDRAGARDVVQGGYEDFLALNGPMLQLCTDWQVRSDGPEEILNDHQDPAYDAAILERLAAIDAELAPVLEDLSDTLARYGSYAPRFADARRRLAEGDLDYLTKPIIPSYHTIWFELHEDLLASLGIDRASEGQR